MILVTGASGHNGSALIRQLAARGASVRAMFHQRPAADGFLAGIEAVTADYSRPESLEGALEGVDRAFLVTPPDEQAVEWQNAFIRAARHAGVRHIVKLSMLGADPASFSRFHRGHGEVEQAIEASGMQWTHLRPDFFMQTVVQYLQGDALLALAGDSRISVVDVNDVATVAAAVLTEPGHENRPYEVTGPEPLGANEFARHLGAALHRDIRVVHQSFEQGRAIMQSLGFKAWNIDGIIELHEWFLSGAAAKMTAVVEQVTGHPPCPFARFATFLAASAPAAG